MPGVLSHVVLSFHPVHTITYIISEHISVIKLHQHHLFQVQSDVKCLTKQTMLIQLNCTIISQFRTTQTNMTLLYKVCT